MSDEPITEPSAETKPEALADNYCVLCDRTFKNLRGYNRHMTMAHGADSSEPKTSGPKGKRGVKIEEGLQRLYGTLGLAVTMISPEDGAIILANSDAMAESMTLVANEYPQVKKAIEKLLKGSAIGAVIMAHIPVIVGIAANHMDGLPSLPFINQSEAKNGES